MDFSDKTCLIIGGTNGLGQVLARELASRGAELILVGRNADSGATLEAALGNRVRFLRCDITSSDAIYSLFDRIESDYPQLNCAVNNAGITAPRAPVSEIDLAAWRQVLETNLTGPMQCISREIQLLSRHTGGAIVNVSSCAGVRAIANQAAYSVSKAALNCLTQVAAIENAVSSDVQHAVRINAVSPGPTLGGMNTPEQLAKNPEATSAKLAVTAMKRMAAPEEIVQAILFLLSDQASYITGTIMDVDGGYSCGKF